MTLQTGCTVILIKTLPNDPLLTSPHRNIPAFARSGITSAPRCCLMIAPVQDRKGWTSIPKNAADIPIFPSVDFDNAVRSYVARARVSHVARGGTGSQAPGQAVGGGRRAAGGGAGAGDRQPTSARFGEHVLVFGVLAPEITSITRLTSLSVRLSIVNNKVLFRWPRTFRVGPQVPLRVPVGHLSGLNTCAHPYTRRYGPAGGLIRGNHIPAGTGPGFGGPKTRSYTFRLVGSKMELQQEALLLFNDAS
ncbi:hypothetical protein GGX14DRAFT_406625 [Mycena pura]|uniref:Uncharacterized protein n=1 Tax=Mycena pura TaxID=153505 RepID=A0AAD6URG6_9AGAR|nr:hypothetical protein GGX14DRAFT_406625 [Mycena pura]